MFILIMQFLWKYIDDLMGKGLGSLVILELLFYVSASLIPLALPLAILLSSIMTFGNLAENNELTALKSSGLSLYRIMRPLLFVVTLIALFTFYFANYVIPVANLKWHSLIYDIQNTKIAAIITPGVYSTELDGYAIKVQEGTEDHFKDILIHDHTNPKEIKSVRASEGKLYKSVNGKYLFFELKDGYVSEELEPQAPTFGPTGVLHRGSHNNRPCRRSHFEQATYKIDIAGFSLKRSEDELFADKHEMLNVFQIYHAVDSVRKNGIKINYSFLSSIKNDHPYFQSLIYKTPKKGMDPELEIGRSTNIPSGAVVFDSLNISQKARAISLAHRKFALTATIIVLFLIGAPLGAIIRKGGFGAPVVIAALLFMIYFVLISVGESLANSEVVSPFLGMWFATMILTPIALILLRAAANDAPVFNRENWALFFRRLKKKNATAVSHQ
jgi:lipopolysaccharide export system permease protein